MTTPTALPTVTLPLTVAQIATAVKSPLVNVTGNWPLIAAALAKHSICSLNTQIAAIGTVATETGTFLPLHEYGSDAYLSKYDHNPQLGNIQPGDGVKYCGRGFIQLTGRANYTFYGTLLGLDLIGNPALAMEPAVSAEVLALFFVKTGVPHQAEAGQWTQVRKLVNGGTNGLASFLQHVAALQAALPH